MRSHGNRAQLSSQPDAGLPDIQLRPDFTIAVDGRLALVGDAKWKRLAGSPLVTADLYQVITYCTALGNVERGLLVYPGRHDRVWKYRLARGRMSVEIRMLRVAGKRESCARSLRRLVCVTCWTAQRVASDRSGPLSGTNSPRITASVPP